MFFVTLVLSVILFLILFLWGAILAAVLSFLHSPYIYIVDTTINCRKIFNSNVRKLMNLGRGRTALWQADGDKMVVFHDWYENQSNENLLVRCCASCKTICANPADVKLVLSAVPCPCLDLECRAITSNCCSLMWRWASLFIVRKSCTVSGLWTR